MKNILLINGHPNKESYNYALAKAYHTGAKTHTVNLVQINIADLSFNPNLQYGYSKKIELEVGLVDAIDKIKWSNHIVWVFPIWWYGYPAIMKGFIDRTFIPDVTFKYTQSNGFPEKLLKGKTGRLIVTSDTPKWYYDFFMKAPATNQLKKGTLEFCGVSPVKTTYISPIKNSSIAFREKWLKKVQVLGEKLK